VSAVSDAARQARAQVMFLAPPSLGVLRVVRVDVTEWPQAVQHDAQGRTITGLLSFEWVFPITRGATSIGRGLQNDLVLLDPSVSRDHARLVQEPDGWWIENLSEHNALWAGEREIPAGQRAHVAPGALLTLGNTTLQFLTSSEWAPRPARAISPPAHVDSEQPDEQETLTPFGPHATGEITALEAGATNLLSPGVTLQFALSGKFGPRARWLLAGGSLLLFLLCAVLTLGLAALIGRNALVSGGLDSVFIALTIPLVPAVGVALLVLWLDRYEREPPLLLLAAFLWGAVIAIPPVLFVEGALNQLLLGLFGGAPGPLASAVALAVSAGATEETIKGAGLLLLLYFLRDEFDNVTDGVLYGALIGAGFAMVENYVYFASAHGDLGVLILGRVVLGWLGHSTFTAIFGAALGLARERHLRRGAGRAPLIGFALGMLLHTLFDFVAFSAEAASASGILGAATVWLGLFTVLLDYLPLFGAQAVLLKMVLLALNREAATVREYLAQEVAAGTVTPDEYVLVQNAALRGVAERQYLFAYGLRAYLTARSLYQTATGLAFRRWHVAQGDAPKPTVRQPEDAYRERITRLRRSLQRQLRTHMEATGQVAPARQVTSTLTLRRF
jgi:RsiW-degrading membrane proteinase PrsW (M82 family)